MKQVQRIVICGTSVFIMSIEAGLTALPGMEVMRVDPRLPAAVERITALEPDIVLAQHDGACADLTLTLVNRGLPLLELDARQNHATLLSSARVVVAETDDLVRVIERALNANLRDAGRESES